MLDHLEQQYLALTARDKKTKTKDVNIPWDQDDNIVEEHRSLGGSIISRLDNGAFVGLFYSLLVFS